MSNTNDIDSILNSIFANGRLNTSGAVKKDGQAAPKNEKTPLGQAKAANDRMNETLQQNMRSIEQLNRSARQEMDALQVQLMQDGLAQTSFASAEPAQPDRQAQKKAQSGACAPQELPTRFRDALAQCKKEVIGQDDFLQSLQIAFKRPLVTGKDKNLPAACLLVCGKNGTGRHSAIRTMTQKLYEADILSGGEVCTVNLADYPGQAEQKLFLQDVFMAFESSAAVILFENCLSCGKTVQNMLSSLVKSGTLQLETRYVLQKGMLVDAGTALVPNAVSALSCKGKYIIFVAQEKPEKIADAYGAGFIDALDDICTTKEFTPQSIDLIARHELAGLAAQTKDKLAYTLQWNDEAAARFAQSFSLLEGVEGIAALAQTCYHAFCEHKLQSDALQQNVMLCVSQGMLAADFGAGAVPVLSLLKKNYSADLDAVKDEIGKIVGLTQIKNYIFSLEENFRVQQLRKEKGLKASATSMHMIFTGNPGTGKTTIARLVSRYLKAIGVLGGGQLVEVTRADLVGRYVGHTAPQTTQVITSALGGVLFIDEAYSLYRGEDDSFGLEAIDTLVKQMEDHRDELIVILAGYSAEMEQFLTANSGLRSRFPNVIEFPDYTGDELLQIAQITAKSKGYWLSEDCMEPLLAYFNRVQAQNSRLAGNGRLVRNQIESAILQQSKRVVAQKDCNLEVLLPCDFDLSEKQ